MARFVFPPSLQSKLPIAAAYLAASLGFGTPAALAQHGGGGHFGGGAHMAAPHISAPHVSAPSAARGVARSRFSGGPPPAGFGAPGFHFRPRPIRPRPVLAVVPVPIFFGGSFFGWPGYGFNSLWWPGCDPFLGWGFGCNAFPYYGYGSGGYVSPYSSPYAAPSTAGYAPPAAYSYSEEEGRRPQLYLKDGSVYEVTDYWLVDGQMHFTTIEGGGTKSVEHIIPFDDLDLQRTIDVNTRLGFRFVLRNAPVEQYLQQNRDEPDRR